MPRDPIVQTKDTSSSGSKTETDNGGEDDVSEVDRRKQFRLQGPSYSFGNMISRSARRLNHQSLLAKNHETNKTCDGSCDHIGKMHLQDNAIETPNFTSASHQSSVDDVFQGDSRKQFRLQGASCSFGNMMPRSARRLNYQGFLAKNHQATKTCDDSCDPIREMRLQDNTIEKPQFTSAKDQSSVGDVLQGDRREQFRLRGTSYSLGDLIPRSALTLNDQSLFAKNRQPNEICGDCCDTTQKTYFQHDTKEIRKTTGVKDQSGVENVFQGDRRKQFRLQGASYSFGNMISRSSHRQHHQSLRAMNYQSNETCDDCCGPIKKMNLQDATMAMGSFRRSLRRTVSNESNRDIENATSHRYFKKTPLTASKLQRQVLKTPDMKIKLDGENNNQCFWVPKEVILIMLILILAVAFQNSCVLHGIPLLVFPQAFCMGSKWFAYFAEESEWVVDKQLTKRAFAMILREVLREIEKLKSGSTSRLAVVGYMFFAEGESCVAPLLRQMSRQANRSAVEEVCRRISCYKKSSIKA